MPDLYCRPTATRRTRYFDEVTVDLVVKPDPVEPPAEPLPEADHIIYAREQRVRVPLNAPLLVIEGLLAATVLSVELAQLADEPPEDALLPAELAALRTDRARGLEILGVG